MDKSDSVTAESRQTEASVDYGPSDDDRYSRDRSPGRSRSPRLSPRGRSLSPRDLSRSPIPMGGRIKDRDDDVRSGIKDRPGRSLSPLARRVDSRSRSPYDAPLVRGRSPSPELRGRSPAQAGFSPRRSRSLDGPGRRSRSPEGDISRAPKRYRSRSPSPLQNNDLEGRRDRGRGQIEHDQGGRPPPRENFQRETSRGGGNGNISRSNYSDRIDRGNNYQDRNAPLPRSDRDGRAVNDRDVVRNVSDRDVVRNISDRDGRDRESRGNSDRNFTPRAASLPRGGDSGQRRSAAPRNDVVPTRRYDDVADRKPQAYDNRTRAPSRSGPVDGGNRDRDGGNRDRDGGNRDRDSGNRDRDGGNRDRDGGNRDGGNRDGGNRDAGVRDSGSRDIRGGRTSSSSVPFNNQAVGRSATSRSRYDANNVESTSRRNSDDDRDYRNSRNNVNVNPSQTRREDDFQDRTRRDDRGDSGRDERHQSRGTRPESYQQSDRNSQYENRSSATRPRQEAERKPDFERRRSPPRQANNYEQDRNPCRDFVASGTCSFGNNCRFSHNGDGGSGLPLVRRGYCRLFEQGTCHFGSNCRYIHDENARAGGGDDSGYGKAPSSHRSSRPGPYDRTNDRDRQRICFSYRDSKTCSFGDECKYSHND